ncbi:protein translocase subunit SecF [Shewanella sp. UCD-KL12]|uniref:protein translocase subunit SecF n=1 Tax=Shewanella sp. UCD-KL12 TaxID=1917163 RepID=UPI000970958B|nr:protein translocase subunit SecF [Shewanella sp. UCD-KL12]
MKNFPVDRVTQGRYISSVISIVLMVISITTITINGFNWGLDFTGGVVSEIRIDKNIKPAQIQNLLGNASHQEVSVISAGEPGRWVLRYSEPEKVQDVDASVLDVKQVLFPLNSDIEVLNTSIVGPQIGQELAEQGGLALLVAMLCILGYLSFRFEWRLASGALFALIHDVVFVLAFFSLTQMEVNLTVLAAVLAILGYSLNDSIIIADRIRELLTLKPKMAIDDICTRAVKATFSRTMVTSGTTLMTVSALWVMGGGPLESFSIAMFIGILTGTWSSISVGTCLPELFGVNAEHYKVIPISDTP